MSPIGFRKFQPNLAQSMVKGIQVCSNEGPRSFTMGDNYEIAEYLLIDLTKICLLI